MSTKPRMSTKPSNEDFDPGATLCGHAPRHERAHYLGGGLWVCFECFAKLLLGSRYTAPQRKEAP